MIYNFSMLNVPFANGAISTEIAPFPDWNRGLGIAFDQTEGKPEMKGLNGLFQVLTTSMLYLKQRGIAEWDASLEYPANAFVTDGARLYKSKRVNTNKQPSLSQLDWDVWASISDISVSTNGNLKKTVAADGSVTLEVPTATNAVRGVVRQATSTEVVNGSNVNAFINPANVGQTFWASLSTDGWCRLPNGLIMQWGTVDYSERPTEGDITINFPIAFPNNCLNVQATRKIAASSTLQENDGGILVVSINRVSVTLNIAYFTANTSKVRGFTWFAIGH